VKRILGIVVAPALCFSIAVGAQQSANPNPAPAPPQQRRGANGALTVDPAVGRGRQVFAQNCGFCHGPDARGGAEGGVDLTRSGIVLGGLPGGPSLADFLKTGRPPRMPAFNNLTDEQVADIIAFVKSEVSPAFAGGRTAAVAIVGDASAGKDFFNGAGKCYMCHSESADLKGIGAKYSTLILQGRIVLPRGNGGYPGLFFGEPPPTTPEKLITVTVTESDGHVTSGSLVSVSDFDVTLKDADGITHTFVRNGDVPKVVITDPLQAHRDMLPKLTNEQMHNLTAYLATLK
jgi:cytochrome c oxidase cbb3-type subunit 3